MKKKAFQQFLLEDSIGSKSKVLKDCIHAVMPKIFCGSYWQIYFELGDNFYRSGFGMLDCYRIDASS